MAHFLASDDKYRDLIHDEDHRSYLSGYQFGRTHRKHIRARTALSRVNGYLKNMIEAIANAKLRRMERERELRGIRLDRPNDSWVALKSRPTKPSPGSK
jgi:hypothetical protein